MSKTNKGKNTLTETKKDMWFPILAPSLYHRLIETPFDITHLIPGRISLGFSVPCDSCKMRLAIFIQTGGKKILSLEKYIFSFNGIKKT